MGPGHAVDDVAGMADGGGQHLRFVPVDLKDAHDPATSATLSPEISSSLLQRATYLAPVLAASTACPALKTSVQLVEMFLPRGPLWP